MYYIISIKEITNTLHQKLKDFYVVSKTFERQYVQNTKGMIFEVVHLFFVTNNKEVHCEHILYMTLYQGIRKQPLNHNVCRNNKNVLYKVLCFLPYFTVISQKEYFLSIMFFCKQHCSQRSLLRRVYFSKSYIFP